jgi:hypothetical protein
MEAVFIDDFLKTFVALAAWNTRTQPFRLPLHSKVMRLCLTIVDDKSCEIEFRRSRRALCVATKWTRMAGKRSGKRLGRWAACSTGSR